MADQGMNRVRRDPANLMELCAEIGARRCPRPRRGQRRADEQVPGKAASCLEAEIKSALRARTIAHEITPMLCGSAFKNKGVAGDASDAVIDYLPSPVDIAPVKGQTIAIRKPAAARRDSEPSRHLAFKIMTEIRMSASSRSCACYSGVLSSGDTIYNAAKARRSASAASADAATSAMRIKEVLRATSPAAVG